MPELIVKLGDRVINRYPVDKDVVSVGRARDNDIVIENLSVSRNHARIKRSGDQFVLNDLGSANGTLVNGSRVTKVELAHNDVLTVGKHTLIYVDLPEETMESPAQEAINTPTPLAAPRTPTPSPQDSNPLSLPTGRVLPARSASSTGVPRVGSVPIAEHLVGVLTAGSGRQAGQEFHLRQPEVAIGRAPGNDVRLFDWAVARRHAVIHRSGASFFIRDLESWRGTQLDGRPVSESELRDGSQIVIGETELLFRITEAANLGAPPQPLQVVWPLVDGESDDIGMESLDFGSNDMEAALAAQIDLLDENIAPGSTSDSINIDLESDDDDDADNLTGFGDDEFAPMTEEELEALESEADFAAEEEDEEARRATWGLLEDEKSLHSDESSDRFSLIDAEQRQRAEEEAALEMENMAGLRRADVKETVDPQEQDKEEEESLYGDSMTEREPMGEPEAPAQAPEPPVKPEARDESSVRKPPSSSGIFPRPGVEKDILMWEKALRNKSLLIRKNAAKELKKLTGKDYDWKSEPSGN